MDPIQNSFFPWNPQAEDSVEFKMKESKNQKIHRVILASGCFWGAQDLLRKIDGVLITEVGYSGGVSANPQYPDVKTGKTGHAEVVDIYYNSMTTSLTKILDVFFRMHDPTTEDQQGNDLGSQYRSAIFFFTLEQKKVSEEKIKEIEKKGFWPGKIVTEITPASNYFKAEEYHQDYLVKNPQGYSCHFLRSF